MASVWALAVALFAGCGPVVGGTGTGSAAFEAFVVSAASVCEGALAAELGCPAAPGAAAPGAPAARFVDAAGHVTLEVNGNVATLDAVCLRLRFDGEFAVGAGGLQGFFGSYQVGGAGVDALAALLAVPVAGGGAMTIELRDTQGRVVINPVLLQRTTAVMPAPNPC